MFVSKKKLGFGQQLNSVGLPQKFLSRDQKMVKLKDCQEKKVSVCD